MKRFTFLLVIILLFSLTACDDNSTDQNHDCSHIWSAATCTEAKTCITCNQKEGNALGHLWSDATCTEAKTCSRCNEVDGVALGHTTDSGTCTRCGENMSSWKLGEYNDEFGMPSGDKYIITDAYGTFSNSATTNSTLYAAVQIDNEDIGIMLWEYGNYLVKGTFDYENYSITILDESGVKHSFTGTIYKGSSRVYFKSGDRAAIINLLQNNATLKIYLKSSKYSISTYLFTIETKGFSKMYKKLS